MCIVATKLVACIVAFNSAGSWNFDYEYARNEKKIGVDNSSSSKFDYRKKLLSNNR